MNFNRKFSVALLLVLTLCFAPAQALPAGYVSQGGLTWMPVASKWYNYANASALCAGTINGQTGWRLPTVTEISGLYGSGAMNGQGWSWTDFIWSSTPTGTGSHYIVAPQGMVTSFTDMDAYQVTCVTSASQTSTPACIAPQVLQNGVCVTPTPTCTYPQVLQNGVCVTPTPTCYPPQVLQNGVCVTPAPITYSQTISTITFLPATLAVGSITTASATASSGLPVSFASTTPSICAVSGNTVKGISAGICSITGNQSGNSSYSAAPPVTQSITIPQPTLYALTVGNSGTGSGSVTSSDNSINCGNTCSASYSSGTSVTLTAAPASGSTFAGWGGACTGTGICTLSVNAATNVTAIFNPAPFAVTTTGVTAGIITAPTVTTRISFNAADVGKTGAVFVTAWVPAGTLTPAQQAKIASYTTLVKPMDATSASITYVLVQLTPSGWQPVVNGQLIPYATGVLGDQLASLKILDNTDTTKLPGAQFCVGYGTSVQDMIANGKMQLIGTASNANAAKQNTGSCNVALPISDARVFAFAVANYASLFAGTASAGQVAYQGNSYDYRYYAGSTNYLAVDTQGAVWIMGPAFNPANAPIRVGPVENYRSVITTWEGMQ